MSSKKYFAPFAPAKSPDYDENALASQFDLPKTDVTSPRGDYLHGSTENKLAANDKARDSSSVTGHPAFGSDTSIKPTAKPQTADSLFDQPETAVAATSNTRQTPQYGTTSPIEQGFTANNIGQLAAGTSQVTQPTTVQPNQIPFDAGTLYNQHPNASPSTYAMGQPTPQVYDPNSQLQGANSANAYMNMTPSNTTPQMVASAQGTGYVGNSPDYTNLLATGPTTGPTANPTTGFPNPTVTPMTGVPVQQQPSVTTGHQQPMQPSIVNPSTTYTNTDSIYGTPYNNNNVMTPQTPAMQQPVNGSYQSGFNYFAPTSDTYQPGGVY